MRYLKTFESFDSLNTSPEDEAIRYFDEIILQQAKDNDYAILCYMQIDDFIAVCNKGFSDKKEIVVNDLIKNGIKFNEIPYLNFTHDYNGSARVVGHEGRHRAKMLKSLGAKTLPVLMKSFTGGEGSYVINKENMIKRPPYFEEEFPKVLKGELENSQNSVAFPIKL